MEYITNDKETNKEEARRIGAEKKANGYKRQLMHGTMRRSVRSVPRTMNTKKATSNTKKLTMIIRCIADFKRGNTTHSYAL